MGINSHIFKGKKYTKIPCDIEILRANSFISNELRQTFLYFQKSCNDSLFIEKKRERSHSLGYCHSKNVVVTPNFWMEIKKQEAVQFFMERMGFDFDALLTRECFTQHLYITVD